ncbi:heat-inducible protein [Aliarcobacter thereius]|nr:META domain-containing protein [Aliarcobacter thereius]OCL88597.1 heat-inducible protein [Aliarcobacter thereius]OCL92091.1 heat-inducible protein [Aliarcobacter thereius]OCL94813.1 heat-inducible protein [Aliarcobacter thereius LMG 24486]OCM00260.1 heat-inducible protein [Aliarcobacter thereius]
MYKRILFILTFISTLFFTACTKSNALEEASFKALEFNSKEILNSPKVANISFGKDLKVYGNLGCNNFFGTYLIEKSNLVIGEVGSTMMMCKDMETEREFLNVLESVKTYTIKENNLIFFDKDNKIIAKFVKE